MLRISYFEEVSMTNSITYEEWLASVPSELTNDPLWNMKVYRLAVFLGDLAWYDVSKLAQDKRTVSLSDQLYRAVGSVINPPIP